MPTELQSYVKKVPCTPLFLCPKTIKTIDLTDAVKSLSTIVYWLVPVSSTWKSQYLMTTTPHDIWLCGI